MKDPFRNDPDYFKLGKDLYSKKSTGEHVYKQSTYPNATTKIIDGKSVFFPEGITKKKLKTFKKKALKPGDPGYEEELEQLVDEIVDMNKGATIQ
jgi:hypothetical protein|tara:strand:- start:3843 stop:4127 length:285 start_codon:yes stop_codon:yes gene_type:complete